MVSERVIELGEHTRRSSSNTICFPVDFVHHLAKSRTLQNVLDTVATWIHHIFDAERVSITLADGKEYLKLYTISGNQAIPIDFRMPIEGSFVGRVFKNKTLIICDDVTLSDEIDCKMLGEYGLNTCMDAPLISGDSCIGTLNVAHKHKNYYRLEDAEKLQCIANWISINIALHLQLVELELLATTDELTGSFNRRCFIKELKERLNDYHQKEEAFFVAILDLDEFKKLNDSYGHDMGDKALQYSVDIIDAQLGDDDLLARIGGEEFGIIMSNSSMDEALACLEKIRAAIASFSIDCEGQQIHFTASIGLAKVDKDDSNIDLLVKRADMALYDAKGSGRNRIAIDQRVAVTSPSESDAV
ncbi:sensor domain-containing diguanylate cyclase [Vibrio fluvialis]|nr:sensor domain-containing diguanylate cyclase [Vibrio fluvialis]MBY8218678.1 sensor domain-containing diguanylate cyclase [Vibrio fluvialis]